ncbi:MAG: S41 family peptidase [Candidatus Kapaibacterium sp.]
MKRFLLVSALLLIAPVARGQDFAHDTTGRLYYTAKVWGYLKYFHPAVNGCNKNLDSILVVLIPEIENDTTDSTFNASLLKMFNFAGPMPTAITPAPSLTPEETINLNLVWQHDSILSLQVQALLDSVRVNFRPVQSCYYENNPNYFPPYLINENDYPPPLAITEPYRLLTLFRVWNMYNYFYPYKTLLDSSWDSTLMGMIPVVHTAQTTLALQLAMMEFQSKLQDAHAATNSDTLTYHFGYHYLPMVFSYIDSQTVVTKAFQGITQVKRGDVVLKIDGMPTQMIRDTLRKYTPGGNLSVINWNISIQLLAGTNRVATLVVDNGSGPRTVLINRSAFGSEVYDSIDFWQGDGSHWKILPGNIGYVNMGIVDSFDVETMFPVLKNAPAIIFDMRNYPQDFILDQWCDSLLRFSVPFAKWFFPDPMYPGTGKITVTNCGPVPANPNYYKGKVILLVNEETLSRAEYFAMAFSKAPKSIIVGSQTAGADGNTDYTTFPTEITTYYTSWGISYADGRQTQRVGIVPNIVVRPTIADIRAGIDPVLDTAIIVAGGNLAVKASKASPTFITAYPNPVTNSTTLRFTSPESGYATVTLVNPLGEEVFRVFAGELGAGEHSFPVAVPAGLTAGMYECVVRMNGRAEETGIVVQP